METIYTNLATSKSQANSAEIPPEEEELFREFQSYVRSIYTAATDGAVQSLTSATARLKLEVDQLSRVVVQSRDDYQRLFEPAISDFKASAERTLALMSQRQEELTKQQEQRIAEALQQLAQEHQAATKQNADSMSTLVKSQAQEQQAAIKQNAESMTALVKSQAKQFLWIMTGMGLVLIAILILLIFRTAR
jgi:Fe2+ transport system protein B